MKKILLFASALAGLFLASCQKEQLEPVAENGQVTFTIEAPAAIQTKAIADGLNVDQLIYEVWITGATANQEDLSKATRLYQATTDMVQDGNRMKANITLDLVNDQNFTVLFWAQKKGIDVYNTEWLNAVTYTNLNAKAYAANDNRLDAFYSKAFVSDGATSTPTVTLRRPFAQVNLCTLNNKEAAQTSSDYNIALSQSKMRLDAVPTVFNVATSAATNYVAMEFAYYDVPSGDDQMITVNGKEYYYAGMNYVFAGANIALTYDIATKLNGTVDANVNNTIANVPLKENHRTNIVGNLLTSKVDYEIIVDAAFGEPAEMVEVVSVSTAAELVEALTPAAGSTPVEGESTNIKFEGDINLSDLFASLTKSTAEEPKNITIPAGLTTTIDLNGYSLTGVDEGTASFGLIYNCGNLTITNSSSTQSRIALVAQNNRGWNAYSSVLSNNPGGNLLVKGNVLIEHLGGTDMAYGIDNLTNSGIGDVNVTIDGATVKSTYRAIRQFLNCDAKENNLIIKAGSKIESTGDNKSVWMQDSSKKANRGSLVVEEGAELYGNVYISATAGSTEWPVSASVAASALKEGSVVEISPKELVGYNVVLNDGVYVFEQSWSVDGDEYTVYTAAGLKWVADEVNKVGAQAPNIFDNAVVKLANDIDLNNVEWTPIGDYGFNRTVFRGIFDGQGYTISNFKITRQASRPDKVTESSYGLFGNMSGTVQNLNINNAAVTLEQGRFAGALVGRLKEGALVDNCHVTNSNVTIKHWQVGGIAGQVNDADIKNSSISSSTVTGYAGVGAISGFMMVAGDYVVENCEINDCDLVQNGSFGNDYDSMFGLVAGYLNHAGVVLTINNVSVENNTINDAASTVLVGDKESGAKVYVDGSEVIAPGLSYKSSSKTYAVSSAEGLVAMSSRTIKGGESVVLTADIDLEGVDFNGLSAFNSENPNTFDGQDHVVSNWTNEKGASDMGFIKSWVGTIQNLTIENASLKTNGRSAIIAANTYCNIENCHVVNCTLEDSYWACGLIAGLYNSGSVSNCSATNSSVKSNGGTAAIVGVVNETAGTRSFTNCVVTGCTVNNTGVYGEGYSAAMVCGVINISNSTVKFAGCELSNNTKLGEYVGDLYYSSEGNNVVVE